MAILIEIDHGNDSIKTEHQRFRSGLTAHRVMPPVADKVLEYKDTYYTLSRERIPYQRDKTKDDRYFMLTLFAVAQELLSREMYQPHVEVDLAVALPPEHYGVLKDKFVDYFKRGSVSFVYGGKPFCIVIRHVIVAPQGYVAVLAMDKMYSDMPNLFIIESGGYTNEVGLLRYGAPDMSFNRSLEMGTIPMYNEISRLVNAQHDMMLNEDQILATLLGGETRLPESVIETTKAAAVDHTTDFLNKLRELKVDLRSNPSLFMGGATVIFQPTIEASQMVLDPHFETDAKCNVWGLRLFAQNRIAKLEQGAR